MRSKILLNFLLFFGICTGYLSCQELSQDVAKRLLCSVEDLTVDLREPLFCDGVITTDQGGVISGPDIRIQARKFVYVRKETNNEPCCTVEAEGDLILELGEYILVGERLEYDFLTRTGFLYCGRAGISPWYVGGTIIELRADNSYFVTNGFVTTSESFCPDWQISADRASLQDDHLLCASNVRFRLLNTTFLWLPHLQLDLDLITRSPIRYTLGWGGKQGPRIGLSYLLFEWNRWKTFLRADCRLKRGLGGGIETNYLSLDRRESFDSINYFAWDSSIFNKHEQYRYRFQGNYYNSFCDDRLTVALTYDKLSDKYMPIDYADQSLDIEVAERTQLDIRRQEDDWIASCLTRVRINSFETVKQELPTLEMSWRPFVLGDTGVVADYRIQTSYLDFAYANNVLDVHDYSASRIAFLQRLYRPILMGPLTIMPEAGSATIFYGNGPHDARNWLVTGLFGCEVQAPIYRYYSDFKHVIVPYAKYQYFTFPTSSPKEHFIFDINDGWYRLNALRFGTTHSLYTKDYNGLVRRVLYADVYAYAFFNTKTIPTTIPRAYFQATYYPTETIRHSCDVVWNFAHQQLDRLNLRTEWTFSPDLAVYLEYRHRGAFDWRKAVRDNFILESFRSEKRLRRSSLSDRSSMALLHFFYRFHPNWAVEYEARHGWHWKQGRQFHEFEIDLVTTVRSSVQVKLSYQHKESEDRIAVYFSVWPQGPEHERASYSPAIEF